MILDEQRKMLGEFVRAHRERLSPDQASGRRRTPGLRREELAARAGISATWLTWIEQGRDVQASPHALARLAKALHLTRAEREYLFDIAGKRDPDAGPEDEQGHAPGSISAIVNAISYPAYGLDRLWNISTCNESAVELFGEWMTSGPERNLLRFIFLDPAARDLIDDWPGRAARIIAEFRSDFGHNVNDPPMLGLVRELSASSPDFERLWKTHAVLEREGGERRFHHRQHGTISFRQHTLRPSERTDHKVVILEPENNRKTT